MTARSALALVLVLSLVPAASAKKDRKTSPKKGAAASAPSPVPAAGCKEPPARDPALAQGLASYAAGDWNAAAATLQAWSETPGADADPAAARGMYALAYSLRTAKGPAAATAAIDRAQPLLEARIAKEPTLEAWYYLQGLHQMRNDVSGQLAAVSSALQAVESGSLCPTRDGDDWFRLGRLHGFAGNQEKRSEAMRAAGEAFTKAGEAEGPASPYRALVEKELGDAALVSNDLEAAELHFGLAAKLDPSIPGVHREYGLVLLRRGKLEQAAAHWRSTWRLERQGGNQFMYAIPVINKVLERRKQPGAPGELTGLSQFTVPALEQNAKSEGAAFLTLRADMETALKEGREFPAEKEAEMKAAEYRCLQYLLEYVARGSDLQEFALQNGLLPVIHGRGLPSR